MNGTLEDREGTPPIVQVAAARGRRPAAERPRSPLPMVVYALGALALVTAVPALVLRQKAQVMTVHDFSSARAQSRPLEITVDAVGSWESRVKRTLNAPSAGVLERWDIREGQDVRAGQPLGRLSSPELEQQVQDARANLEEARAGRQDALQTAQTSVLEARARVTELALQNAEVERDAQLAERLFALGVESRATHDGAQRRLDGLRLQLEVARQKVRQAQATLAALQTGAERRIQAAERALRRQEAELDRQVVRAPIAGRVVALSAEEGQALPAGAAMVTGADPLKVQVNAKIDESLAAELREGQPVRVPLEGQSLTGRLAHIGTQAVEGEGQAGRQVDVQVTFTAPPKVRLGSSAPLEIITSARARVLTLPAGPYLASGGQRTAFVVQGDHAERRNVQYGQQNASFVEVLSGIQAGEQVITSSYETYRDQRQVRVAQEK